MLRFFFYRLHGLTTEKSCLAEKGFFSQIYLKKKKIMQLQHDLFFFFTKMTKKNFHFCQTKFFLTFYMEIKKRFIASPQVLNSWPEDKLTYWKDTENMIPHCGCCSQSHLDIAGKSSGHSLLSLEDKQLDLKKIYIQHNFL